LGGEQKLTRVVGGVSVTGGGFKDLEHRAAAIRPAGLSRAEQVAVGVDD